MKNIPHLSAIIIAYQLITFSDDKKWRTNAIKRTPDDSIDIRLVYWRFTSAEKKKKNYIVYNKETGKRFAWGISIKFSHFKIYVQKKKNLSYHSLPSPI